MDATALTVVGTGVALFVALWKVQGNRFDAVDKRFDAVDKRFDAVDERFDAVDERFDMAEKLNRERFDMAEKLNRERFDMAEELNRERFEAMDRRWAERFDMAENANRERASTGAQKSRTRRPTRPSATPSAPTGASTTCTGICSTRGRRPTCPAPLPPPDSPRRSRWHAGCVHPRCPPARGAGGHGDRLEGMTTMDATILTVLGTGLTAIGTGVALFVALWRVQGNRFDAVDRRFDAAEKLNRERASR